MTLKQGIVSIVMELLEEFRKNLLFFKKKKSLFTVCDNFMLFPNTIVAKQVKLL